MTAICIHNTLQIRKKFRYTLYFIKNSTTLIGIEKSLWII